MNYIDGFVVAVPTKNKEVYLHHAKIAAEVFKEHGALSVVECWGDEVPAGVLTSFPKAVMLKDDETVVFSWITWKDKASHDVGMANAMSDERLSPTANAMPFDGKRMIFGGFQMILQA